MLRAVTLRNCKTGERAKEVGIVRDEEGYLVTGPDLRKFGAPSPFVPTASLRRPTGG
jgi:hypothetical protein